ncbi:haloacid dehalogenase type II [Alicyclobacillus mengziensis]|uniref:Haloacid dehalogenase type II n=1 Tax=Alicyclobacillus mengziensis TaxID=2931921 RepID=A0A9X7W1C0_9BACL|nr:haloacid dehalogenase type II [Alicyclobacillus mengziensis]QSO48958.1 haloacid dehalogenase type II [Alicyclobacillus mengziensis]
MYQAIVFDAYGTLFDVQAVAAAIEKEYPGNGAIVSRIWRQKQLEYTWLRPLMNRYVSFEKVNQDGLRYAFKRIGLQFDDETVTRLANTYLTLPLHPEVPQALAQLQQRCLILSNGTPKMLTTVVENASLASRFEGILSADAVKTYKPDTAVYTLALSHTHLEKAQILFVSSNAWDVAGAKSFGFPVAWINRQQSVPEQLDVLPDHEVSDMTGLVRVLNA